MPDYKNEGTIVSTTFSPLYVYGKIFRRSRASNSNGISPIWPKNKHVQDRLPALITSNIEENPIKYEGAVQSKTLFPLEVYGKHFRRSKVINSDMNSLI